MLVCSRREIPPAAEGGGFEPPVREPVRQFSKLLVSATHPSFQKEVLSFNRGVISLIAGAKVQYLFEPCKFFEDFFHYTSFFLYFERNTGLEPATLGLGSQCSTNWANSACEASLLYDSSWEEKEKSQNVISWLCKESEPIAGLEPATHALRMRCSTNWAISAVFQRSLLRCIFQMRVQRYEKKRKVKSEKWKICFCFYIFFVLSPEKAYLQFVF